MIQNELEAENRMMDTINHPVQMRETGDTRIAVPRVHRQLESRCLESPLRI